MGHFQFQVTLLKLKWTHKPQNHKKKFHNPKNLIILNKVKSNNLVNKLRRMMTTMVMKINLIRSKIYKKTTTY